MNSNAINSKVSRRIETSEFNSRRLLEFDTDVESYVLVVGDELFALRLAHLTTGSVHVLEAWKSSPVLDRIEGENRRVLVVAKSRHGNELYLELVVGDARNTQAPFHVEVGDGAVWYAFENLFEPGLWKVSGPRDVQDFQLVPVGRRWERLIILQYTSSHAEVLHCRTSSEEGGEAHVHVAASLELQRHQIVEVMSQPRPSRVRDPA
jgi:hypothetical protein